jgi:hypothetical protein
MVDNVASMVIESSLVQSLPTLLTSTSIIKMGDGLISAIASEDESSREERQLVSQKMKALEKALQICGQHARQTPGMFHFWFPHLYRRQKQTLIKLTNHGSTGTPVSDNDYEESVVYKASDNYNEKSIASEVSEVPNMYDEPPSPEYPAEPVTLDEPSGIEWDLMVPQPAPEAAPKTISSFISKSKKMKGKKSKLIREPPPPPTTGTDDWL